MFTKEEASRLRHEFWTVFGKYMSPVLSAEGLKINWVNYHTNVKDVYFRMDAGQRSAAIFISLEHPDPEIQRLYFEQFVALRPLLRAEVGEDWDWKLHQLTPDGKMVSKIARELPGVSVFNKDQWGDLITFFKPRIIALDRFWEDGKYAFDALK